MSNLKRYTLYILNMIDILSIIFAHFLAYYTRSSSLFTGHAFVKNAEYSEFLLLSVIMYVLFNVAVLYEDENYTRRNLFHEMISSAKMVFFIVCGSLLYLFFVKKGELFSRLYVLLFSAFLLLIDVAFRMSVKKIFVPILKIGGAVEDVLLITEKDHAGEVLKKIMGQGDSQYIVKGLIITDTDMKGEKLYGIDVISNRNDMFNDIHFAETDSLLIAAENENRHVIRNWIRRMQEEGKIVHVEISEFNLLDSKKTVEKIGEEAIVTYRLVSAMPKRQALFKRILSFLTALLFIPVYLFVTLFAALFLRLESPGPLLVARVRVGKNNRLYFQYRYRIYHLNAAERMKEGKSPYTHIGAFLSKTHLDGFPMILNILVGDMSLVGPKAPNLLRYLQMSAKERNILSILPGAIGYWSCESDTEKLVMLEQSYVEDWSVWKDIAIVIRTICRYISGRSLRRHGDMHIQEEYDFAAKEYATLEPLKYDRSTYRARTGLLYSLYLLVKRILDILISLAALIVLSPLLLVLAVLVTISDGGNPFYSHLRVGKNGKRIKVFKFRSMRLDADDLESVLSPEQLEQYRREFKIKDDPRITKIGEFLRKTSLDELPQLLNVLEGSLSLIGPRPIVEEETLKYGSDVAKLLSVKPGLTGYWQAYARNNATYDTGERQKMEMYYVDHQNIFMDIRIFFKTFITVLNQEGAE